MLDSDTKRRIDTCRDILVGKVPDPKSQVEQITIALIYKFMDDMDMQAKELGGKRSFFINGFGKFAWTRLMAPSLGGADMLKLYSEAIGKMTENTHLPELFRDIFKNAYLPYRDPETLKSFLKEINAFTYDHSEKLGDAFEYLLSVLGSQGDAGQFRTPRHIIDFVVAILKPQKNEVVLDPACGTAGFLISAYKHILNTNTDDKGRITLSSAERKKLAQNFKGYDISPDMVRLSLVNLYLHGFKEPHIFEYDTLTSDDRWNEYADVILANPPFMSPKGGIKPHKRFSVQSKRSEVLFVDYMAEHLSPTGRAGIIVPEGIIFQSQGSYVELRKMLVENSLVAVISLPAGVFNPYSGVKTSILILDKQLARKASSIAFFKVDNDGFGLGAQRRAIDKNDLPTVQQELEAYLQSLRGGVELPALTTGQVVLKEKISANGEYNLSGERYREGVISSHSFPLVTLGDASVFRVESGGTPKSDVDEYWNGGIAWATLVDLPATDFISEIVTTKRTISDKGLHESSAKMIPANSVLVSTRATIGRIAINRVPIATNQGFKNVIIEDPSKAVPEYIALALTKLVPAMEAWATGGTFAEISKSKFCELQIPLPPLEVQKEIVAEIKGYQKVINGARAVIDNYRPHIPIRPDWPMVDLGDACDIKTGKLNSNAAVEDGIYPFFTCSKDVFKINDYAFDCEAILLSGNNASGNFDVKHYQGKFNAYQRTYVITVKDEFIDKMTYGILRYVLNANLLDLKQKSIGGLTRYLTLGMITSIKLPIPPLATQQAIVAEIEAEQALVAANRELITCFEKKIQATLARVWGDASASGVVMS